MLLRAEGCELYIEPQLNVAAGGISNGQNATFLTDYSGNGRTLSAASAYPVYQTSAINSKAGVYWDGTKNPLKNSSNFGVRCGFLVVKINETTSFSNYAGVLTDTSALPILVGNSGTPNFNDNLQDALLFEFRSNDRIYSRDPASGALTLPAPINLYQIIFFRYWIPVSVNGIQVGQDRVTTTRKAKMTLALLALYSTDFDEQELRAAQKTLADNFGLTLADVFPYQADDDSAFRDVEAGNLDFPASGGQIAETLGAGAKIDADLKFTARTPAEVKAARAFLRRHYLRLPFIYRSYSLIPPEDALGYATSLIEHAGSPSFVNKSYGFGFKEN